MPEISIEVRGGDFAQRGFGELEREIPAAHRKQMHRSAYLIGAHFRVYPSKPSTSTYIRTGDLRDSVEIVDMSNGSTVKIDPVSPRGVHYGTYVIGNPWGVGQAWMHKGRWPLLKAVADKVTRTMAQEMESAAREKVRQAGMA